jgi:hypothetical protein
MNEELWLNLRSDDGCEIRVRLPDAFVAWARTQHPLTRTILHSRVGRAIRSAHVELRNLFHKWLHEQPTESEALNAELLMQANGPSEFSVTSKFSAHIPQPLELSGVG